MKDIFHRLLDIWSNRNPKTVFATSLLFAGSGLIGLGVGGPHLEAKFKWVTFNLFQNNPPLAPVITVAGLVMIFIAIGIFCWGQKQLSKKKRILILHSGIFQLKEEDALKNEGKLEILTIDHTPYLENGLISNPAKCLKDILVLNRNLMSMSNGFGQDLVYCGLTQVPFAFTTGREISNKQSIKIKDWNRSKNEWYEPRGPDDLKDSLLLPIGLDIRDSELILKMSISYQIDAEAVARLGIKGVECSLGPENIGIANLDSSAKQIRLAYDFHQILDISHQKNLSMVHIFYSAQASFFFRLGTQINKTLHPPIMVYQYQKNSHPWAVKLEPGAEPEIVTLEGEMS